MLGYVTSLFHEAVPVLLCALWVTARSWPRSPSASASKPGSTHSHVFIISNLFGNFLLKKKEKSSDFLHKPLSWCWTLLSFLLVSILIISPLSLGFSFFFMISLIFRVTASCCVLVIVCLCASFSALTSWVCLPSDSPMVFCLHLPDILPLWLSASP